MKESISENIRCITKDDPEYPVKMKQYPSMPNKLYAKGRLPLAEKPAVAVIGAECAVHMAEFRHSVMRKY